jgi:hypothetical protein
MLRTHFLLFVFIFMAGVSYSQADYTFSLFKSRADAENYLMKKLMEINSPITLVKENEHLADRRRLNIITKTILEKMRLAYPRASIPKLDPQIILIQSPHPKAFTLVDDDQGHTPYLFVVSTDFLKLNDNALAGLVAHELTHLVLQWTDDSGVFYPTEFFHFANGPFTATDPINIELTQKITDFVVASGSESILKFPNIENIRYENREDHADKVAMHILKISKIPSFDYNQALLKYFPDDEDSGNCDMSTEPTYGPIYHVHHSSCWRVWRNSKIH